MPEQYCSNGPGFPDLGVVHPKESVRKRLAQDGLQFEVRPGDLIRANQAARDRTHVLVIDEINLCRRHHRALHEEGYQLERAPDGALQFRRPDGRLLPEVPPPPLVPADPVCVLRAQHEAQGLRLHARTTRPGWLGERPDVGWAIDVLHPLATREATLASITGGTRIAAGRRLS